VIFNGDNYSKEWHDEAERRGLPNIRTTDQALKALVSKETVELFERYHVLSRRELESRYQIYLEAYKKTIDIEGSCALDIAKTMILPAALKQQKKLAKGIISLKEVDDKSPAIPGMKKQLDKVSGLNARLFSEIDGLQKHLEKEDTKATLASMTTLRQVVDALEAEVDDRLWPLPKYSEMLFVY